MKWMKYKSNCLVKIFICSNCDSDEDINNGCHKYGVMRKSLAMLLDETNMCDVIFFENIRASSSGVEDTYLGLLDDADLVVIIVDNKDGIKEGTLKEINRAKATNKKCIYIFCDERERKPTELQKELSLSSQKPKFDIAKEFLDIPNKAFAAVYDDILRIYREYCRGRIVLVREKLEDDNSEISILTVEDGGVTKGYLSGFSYTQNLVRREVGLAIEEVTDPSESDAYCATLLGTIVGASTDSKLDFDSLRNDLKKHYKGVNLLKLVGMRYEAIEAYFAGKLVDCNEKFEAALKYATERKNIPQWIIRDIDIDIRTIQFEIDTEKGERRSKNVYLNSNDEPLYYPIIDRIVSEYSAEMVESVYNTSALSSYISYVKIESLVNKICKTFIVAYYYGSLTQMLYVRRRLFDGLVSVAYELRNHRLFVFLIKQLLLMNDDRALENFLEKYEENTNSINNTDMTSILLAIEKHPLKMRRMLARVVSLKHFGYYYSDDTFETESEQLITKVKNNLSSSKYKHGYNLYAGIMISALKKNINRFKEKKILEFASCVFENKYEVYYREILSLLYKLKLDDLSEQELDDYQMLLINLINDEVIRKNYSEVFQVAQELRKRKTNNYESLDAAVVRNNPTFYEEIYCLNTAKVLTKKNAWKHTKHIAEEIQGLNEQQGVNGMYKTLSYDPYMTIANILKNSKLRYDLKQGELVLRAIRGTLFSDRQTIDAKAKALELFCMILLMHEQNSIYDETCNEIREREQEVLVAKDLLNVQYDESVIEFNLHLLRLVRKESISVGFRNQLIRVQNNKESNLVEVLRVLENLVSVGFFSVLLQGEKDMLIQFLLGSSYHKISKIRFRAMSVLSMIREKEFREICLERLAEMIDDAPYAEKVGLLFRLSKEELDNPKVKYIFDKGKIDSHFWVRKAASRFESEMAKQ